MKPLPPIDVLLLQTLSDGEPTTALELSQTWGEEINRVKDWLKKFEKLGLAGRLQYPEAGFPYEKWVGNRAAIAARLRS